MFDAHDDRRDAVACSEFANCIRDVEFHSLLRRQQNFTDLPVRLSFLAPFQALDLLAGQNGRFVPETTSVGLLE